VAREPVPAPTTTCLPLPVTATPPPGPRAVRIRRPSFPRDVSSVCSPVTALVAIAA
jgi:hypothetical protein